MEHAHKLLSGKTDYLHEPDHVHTRARTHTHRAQEGGVDNRQQKGPKGPEAQPEGLLAFLLQGEKEQKKKKGREVSRFGPRAGNPKKTPAKPQENGGDSEVF